MTKPFYLSSSSVCDFQFLYILTNICYFLFDYSHPRGYKWYLIVICISSMADDFKYLVMYLLVICRILILGASQVALVVRNPSANAGDTGDLGSIPGLKRSPGEGHGNLLQYSCLENHMNRRAWQATVHGVTKSWIQLKQHSIFLSYSMCIFFGQVSV